MPVFLIPVILQFISGLPELIKNLNDVFREKPGTGTTKKEIVLGQTQAVMNISSKLAGATLPPEVAQAILAEVSALTDNTVAKMNAVELFQPKGA